MPFLKPPTASRRLLYSGNIRSTCFSPILRCPVKNDCELAKAMVNTKPDLHVLFISGHVGAEVCRFSGFPLSDLHFLRKPFSAGELASRIRLIRDRKEPLPTGL